MKHLKHIFKGQWTASIILSVFFYQLSIGEAFAHGKYDNTDTLFVAQDGSSEFKTVGEAVEVCRAFMEYKKVIFVKKGIYKEKVIIPSWLTNIEIIGEDRDQTVITYDDHANLPMATYRPSTLDPLTSPNPSCRRGTPPPTGGDRGGNHTHPSTLAPRPSTLDSQPSTLDPIPSTLNPQPSTLDSQPKIGTFRTYTVKVEGCGITFRNITIENNAPRKGQAVALHTEGDRLLFVNCRILGNQDTIYTGMENTRLYFKDCYIDGTPDFIFGPSTAWFEGCEIRSKVNSYVTAASTPKYIRYGYIFHNCKLTADEGVDKVYLGRPWRAYAHTLFIDCDLGSHIVAEGWQNWPDYHDPAQEGTVRYQEYNNCGAGANPQARVPWSRQLTQQEAAAITPQEVFGCTQWITE